MIVGKGVATKIIDEIETITAIPDANTIEFKRAAYEENIMKQP